MNKRNRKGALRTSEPKPSTMPTLQHPRDKGIFKSERPDPAKSDAHGRTFNGYCLVPGAATPDREI